ncbi:MAG TPA: ACP S-malonyltransferase [Candidatus Competibacteraceae bacterium]|nr:ACP S-malonyltransferase [Candidatus Competibacteraceae bacterium]
MSTDNSPVTFLFPGQGSQYPGMGSDLYQEYPTARRIYDQASIVLGYDLAELCFHDPNGQLNLTRFTQPALLTHSIACLEVFKELTDGQVQPMMAAGHSLGEYSALVAAGSLSFEDALRLVQKRGEFMGTYGEGEMLAFPVDLDSARPLAEKHYCAIAACNLADQTVIGGRGEDLDRLTQEAQELFPRKRPVRLKTEGAFHTYFMVSAAIHFRPFLDRADMAPPGIRVLSNYTGGYHAAEPESIKARLFFQLFHPVLWFDNLQNLLRDGVAIFSEFGGGIGSGETPAAKRPNLEGMVKKIMRSMDTPAQYFPVINTQTLQETVTALRNMG